MQEPRLLSYDGFPPFVKRAIDMNLSRLWRLQGLFATIFFTSNLVAVAGWAQPAGFSVGHYSSDNGLPQNSIKGIEKDKIGYLWLATEMGLVRFDGSNFRTFPVANAREVQTTRMVSLDLMENGNISVEGDGGVYYYIDNQSKIHRSPEKIPSHKSAYMAYAFNDSCIAKNQRGQLASWALPDVKSIYRSMLNCLVFLNGWYYYFNKDRELIAADSALSQFRKLAISGSLAAVIRNSDRLKAPVSLLKNGDRLCLRWKETIYEAVPDLASSTLSAIPLLSVGNIANITAFRSWPGQALYFIGTMSEGLYVFRRQPFTTQLFSDIESNVFYAQAPNGYDGTLTKKGVLFPHRTIALTGLTSESLLQTSDGHYIANRWVSKDESGLVEMDEKLHELKFIRAFDLRVHCLRQFRDESVWLSANHHFMGKISGDRIDWMHSPANWPAEVAINTFIEGDSDQVWIGTDKGLANLNVKRNNVHFLDGLTGTNVRFLHIDGKKTLWIGTYGNGLFAFYKNQLIRLPADPEDYLSTTHCILEDKKGYCWLTTNRGLFQASVADLYAYLDRKQSTVYYQYYDRTDGFLTNEFNGGCTPSGIRLNDGRFSFPSVNGLVQFLPESMLPVLPSAIIHVDEILMDTTKLISPNGPIGIPSYVKHLRFSISSPYFGNEYNQRIEYRISGADSNWYPVQKDGMVEFNTLRGGQYNLQFRKKAGFGNTGFIRRDLPFSVDLSFWESWTFKFLMLAVLAAILFLIFRIRIKILVRNKKLLEKEVQERTKEQHLLIDHLEKVVKELEQSKEDLYQHDQFMGKLAMILAHDLKSPLWFFNMAARRLRTQLADLKPGEASGVSLELEKTSASVFNFVNDFSYWLNTVSRKFHVQQERINAPELFSELEIFFAELVKSKTNRMTITVETDAYIVSDRELLKIILRNLVDNANKSTSDGIITVRLDHREDGGIITVTDTGKGMSPRTLAMINRRIREQTALIDETEYGYGYRFIIDFCKLLNLNIQVESEAGLGTRITLKTFQMSRHRTAPLADRTDTHTHWKAF